MQRTQVWQWAGEFATVLVPVHLVYACLQRGSAVGGMPTVPLLPMPPNMCLQGCGFGILMRPSACCLPCLF